MAKTPAKANLTRSSQDILNAIRNGASQSYRDFVPVADASDADSLKTIGNILMTYEPLRNEFLNALMNRIGRVYVTNKTYENPWAMFKKGILELGESIEEIFVDIAKPYQFDPADAENTVFKREIPDVRATFHIMNYQKFYPTTVSNNQLRQAFLSWDGITDLIAKIVEALYTGANYDEFLTMKYMLALHILNGRFYPVQVAEVSAANMKSIVSTVKGVSNDLEFLSNKYNTAGVMNNSVKADQYFIVNSDFDAKMDVEVLASAFNMDKAEFLGRRVLVDGFGKLDTARLELLLGDNPNFVELTSDQLTALNAIPCVIVDRDFFMIFDNLIDMTEQYNGKGLYWNYFYHVWKTFSVSPFQSAVLFVPTAPTVTSVTVSPSTATVAKGASTQLSATVVTTGFAPQEVTWSVSGDVKDVIVDNTGKVTVKSDATSETATVVATSVWNSTVTGSCTITVGA